MYIYKYINGLYVRYVCVCFVHKLKLASHITRIKTIRQAHNKIQNHDDDDEHENRTFGTYINHKIQVVSS